MFGRFTNDILMLLVFSPMYILPFVYGKILEHHYFHADSVVTAEVTELEKRVHVRHRIKTYYIVPKFTYFYNGLQWNVEGSSFLEDDRKTASMFKVGTKMKLRIYKNEIIEQRHYKKFFFISYFVFIMVFIVMIPYLAFKYLMG